MTMKDKTVLVTGAGLPRRDDGTGLLAPQHRFG